MKAVTITFNPSFDTTLFLDGLHFDKANRVEEELTQSGGKGINVGQVVNRLGAEVVAFCLVGKEDRAKFAASLTDNIYVFVEREGKTRENLTLRSKNECVKINRKGEAVDKAALIGFENVILNSLEGGDIAVISGSLPLGYNKDDLAAFCDRLNEKKVKIVLDTDVDLSLLKRVKPFMIKPNEYEIKDITGQTDNINDSARLCASNGVQNVLVSLGEKGMLAVTDNNEYYCMAPKVEAKSTVGAGDSAVAGFVAGTLMGLETEEILKLSVASGTATAMQEGTLLAQNQDIQSLLPLVKVIKNK